MSTPPPLVRPPPLGSIEPHSGLLTQPPEDQPLYKVMTVENLLRSIDDAYLHLNRVDNYGDGPGADPHDGVQVPRDRPGNTGVGFEKRPDFTSADYYDRSRSRTYACCFGLENADYLWHNYGNGDAHGKIGLGHFILNDKSEIVFPASTLLHLDFRAAFMDGTKRRLLCVPETDAAFLRAELENRNIGAAPGSDPPK